MDKQTKIIFCLLGLVLILAIVFGLKVTGIIKSTENPKVETNVVETQDIKGNINENKLANLATIQGFIYGFAYGHLIFISIVISVISIITNIGIAKLYKKMDMPLWTSTLYYIYPFITILFNDIIKVNTNILNWILNILILWSFAYYFEQLGMSKYWPLLPIVASVFGVLMAFLAMPMLGLTLSVGSYIAYIIAYIISNIKLGNTFGKSKAFIVGLAILPFIFRPILDYQK